VDRISRLDGEKYLLLTTFRRDGRPVPTPVWAARDGQSLVVWTAAGSGKVTRIRRNGTVTLAPCTARGRPTGDPVDGRAELLDAAGAERSRELIARKYGLVGRLAMLASRLRRGSDGTVGIRITV
jgi:uncharacterized protein